MSEVKVNKISPRSGTEVTLGDSGDTFTIPSGATINNQGTATNFGATGSASWVTTVKTGDFTAVAGEGYFVNTTGGEITVTLPASPSAGAVVAIKDYAGTFDTNKVTLARNGSNIGGNALNSTLTVEGLAVTLVFVDATKGWLVTDSGLQSEAPGPEFVAATGGNTTLTVCSHKVHIFTGPGTLCVSGGGNAQGSSTVEYLVVAGGGGGGVGADNDGYKGGGGGGAGGWRSFTALSPASPLNGPAGIPVSVQGYPITVGAGGAGSPGQPTPGASGTTSIFSSITSAGGGGGSSNEGPSNAAGLPGGSGGGAAGRNGNQPQGIGGTGNTPPVSPAQGTNGGNGRQNNPGCSAGAGGGGATTAGTNAPSDTIGGPGGAGAFITAPFLGPTAPSYGATGPAGRYFSGGGGGASGNNPGPSGSGGLGGGGAGATGAAGAVTGTVNTGGGAGGTTACSASKAGGSGIVIIRYKFQA